jgi:hypothetical protein
VRDAGSLDNLVRPRHSDGGTVTPRALAVFMSITNSNFAGCSTGRSAGVAPLRIRSTKGCRFDEPAPLDRWRRPPTLYDKDGHSMKYLQRRGERARLYVVRRVAAAVRDTTSPLYLVEGEKKALAVAQCGLPAVGFSGIEGWHLRGPRELLPDFDAIPLAGRVVELAADGDWQTNPNVARHPAPWAAILDHACRTVALELRRGAPLTLLTPWGLAGETRYLLPKLLVDRETNLLYGDGGTGKSLIALAAAVAIGIGVSLPGGLRPTRCVSTLYLDWKTQGKVISLDEARWGWRT